MCQMQVKLVLQGIVKFYLVICMFLFEHCLCGQVSYFEIYMDKIRDLLDGQL